MQVEKISDHTFFSLQTSDFETENGNLAQLGVLQYFNNEGMIKGSSTLLTSDTTIPLRENKTKLDEMGQRMVNIVEKKLSASETNKLMTAESEIMREELIAMGFSVKSVHMVAGRLFNDNRSLEEQIKTPQFVLEDEQSFTERTGYGFNLLFKNRPGVVCTQEICTKNFYGVNFTNIFESHKERHSSYGFICAPDIKSTVNVTCYDKEKFEDVSKNHLTKLSEINESLKCFSPSSNRTLVVALLHKTSDKTYIVANIHAEYPKANTAEPWKVLRKILSEPNVIVCGDFNLVIDNKFLFENEFKDFAGRCIMIPTPDYANVGPATLDFILTSF